MIDDKKKQNGMKACLDRRIDDKVERENMRDPLIAYTRAFDDAIDWFKQAIWHDASEVPQKDQPFITQWKNLWIIDINRSIFPNNDWFSHCKKAKIKQWAYIADLLPKGGEK